MNIPVKHIPSEYKVKVRTCAHDRIQTMNGEVLCLNCDKVLTNRELGFYA